MSVKIKASIKGLAEAIGKIEKLANKTAIAERIAAVLESGTLERFEKEVAPDGSAWKPNLRGGKILDFQGFLKTSISTNIDDDFVEIGSNLAYAAIHQEGGEITTRNGKPLSKAIVMPKRSYLGLSETDKIRINFSLGEFFDEVLA